MVTKTNEKIVAPVTETEADNSTVITLPTKGGRVGGLDAIQAKLSEKKALETSTTQAVRQILAQARDADDKGMKDAAETLEIVNRGALLLYQAIAAGAMTQDSLSSILGDSFGYKVAGKLQEGAPTVTTGVPETFNMNGQKASKTPFGRGEAIRKRVLRAANASAYVKGEEVPYFEGVPVEEVESVLSRIGKDLSIWTAYDGKAPKGSFAVIKADASGQRPKLAFDAKRIAEICGTLGSEGALNVVDNSESLKIAYAALRDQLRLMNEQLAA